MGSMARKFKREQLKVAHKKFGDNWSNNRRLQEQDEIAKSRAAATSPGSTPVVPVKKYDGPPLLRSKPSFSEYCKAYKNAMKEAEEALKKREAEQLKQDAQIDKSWDE